MTTIEKNKLINEFMGIRAILVSPDVYTLSDLPWFTCTYGTPEECSQAFAKYAKYDTSWDWLIPVLEKMSTIENGRFIYELKRDRIEIWDWALRDKGFNYYALFEGKPQNYNLQGGLYNAIVEFILWYNKNK